jgi:hypothetical protein
MKFEVGGTEAGGGGSLSAGRSTPLSFILSEVEG